jgi:NAD(P)-dependent dehydrogenase (short-subunit alcohol dehydrogenase family)
MDVTKRNQIDQVVGDVVGKYGRIDVLVNNAGILLQSLILDLTEEQWDKVMNTNVKSTLLCSQAALPHMINQKGGAIVNLASQAGKRAEHGIFAYCTSKAAVIRLTHCIALEMVEHNIRCNCVCPGPTLGTRMMTKVFTEMAEAEGISFEEMVERGAAELPMKRMAKAEDVAAVIAFLASDESAYMTGQAVNVTGGGVWY